MTVGKKSYFILLYFLRKEHSTSCVEKGLRGIDVAKTDLLLSKKFERQMPEHL